MIELTNSEIALFVGGMFVCYFAGFKIGKTIRLIKDLGNAA